MANLPNTIAMDDLSDDDHDNDMNNNTRNNVVCGYLIRINPSGTPLNTFILTDETTSIGRKKDNQIILMDPTVSSRHAEIEIDIEEHNAYITDLKSTNKTRHGKILPAQADNQRNKAIKPMRQILIKSGDYITFGGI